MLHMKDTLSLSAGLQERVSRQLVEQVGNQKEARGDGAAGLPGTPAMRHAVSRHHAPRPLAARGLRARTQDVVRPCRVQSAGYNRRTAVSTRNPTRWLGILRLHGALEAIAPELPD
jgi:hypothetical protein